MTKGYDKNKERQDALNDFGKALARRSGSKCELCNASGESLTVVNIDPVSRQPELESLLFLCRECAIGIKGGKLNQERWRFLESSAWSDITPVQLASVLLCRRLQTQGITWADELLSVLYINPEVAARLEKEKHV